MASSRLLEDHSSSQQEDSCIPIDDNGPDTGYPPVPSVIKKLLCEFVGTFVLLFGAAGTAIMNEKSGGALGIHGLAGGAGLTVMVVIFATGHISGAHINPAVTVAFATYRHFSWFLVPLYITSQVLACILSSLFLKAMYLPNLSGGVTVPAGAHWQSLLFEIMLTAVMMFVVTAVATDTRAVGELAGIAVGATVFLNNLIGGLISGASMNPVRTLGPAVVQNNYEGFWVYIVGPFLGAQLGAAAYTAIRFKALEPQQQLRRSFKK